MQIFHGQLKNDLEKKVDSTKCETFTTYGLKTWDRENLKHISYRLTFRIAPVNTIVAEDIDGDGHIDLVTAGNEYGLQLIQAGMMRHGGMLLKGMEKEISNGQKCCKWFNN